MEVSKFQHCLLVLLYLTLIPHQAVWADICGKFNIGGPCDMVNNPPAPTTPAPTHVDDPYCALACAEENSAMATYCKCGGVVTTTTVPPTTTPAPQTCYYSTQRPARLSSVVKRLWNPTPTATECDYPGVIGLFTRQNGVYSPACTASLVSEDTLVINQANCFTTSKQRVLFALPNTYQASSIGRDYKTIKGSGKRLDPTNSNGHVFLLKLQNPLTFDNTCVQPACFPNDNIPTSDIDLTDCRIVGYGETTDDAGSFPTQLMEVAVTVDPASITKNILTVNRVDSDPNVPCFMDDSAPLICSHSRTKEWITIGITQSIGYPCSDDTVVVSKVRNMLAEAKMKVYYRGIQGLTYQNPLTFPQ